MKAEILRDSKPSDLISHRIEQYRQASRGGLYIHVWTNSEGLIVQEHPSGSSIMPDQAGEELGMHDFPQDLLDFVGPIHYRGILSKDEVRLLADQLSGGGEQLELVL